MDHVRWQDGATAVEYAILAAAIAAVIVAVVFALGSTTCDQFTGANADFAAEMGGDAGSCA